MTTHIRTCTISDKPAVIALWAAVFQQDKPHNDPTQSFNQKINHADDLFFVAEHKKTLVGTIIAGYDGHRGWIYSLAIDPRYRRKGIGTLLMKKAITILHNKGCLKVNLQITGNNQDLITFYKTLGFTIEDRISMGKNLY
ncbi:MAG: GNAT family acetyltransferase [Candidatus Thermoplasmatota archaeon]|nr:GNAT family acetyltransferase [Candidatus Thermoplasmatota archaeon]MBU1941216.1 GNAT family acetyltransferase [Candidatus Thermoplasmatota archaeon]